MENKIPHKTFIEACLAGEATATDIDDWIDMWHRHEDISLKLHEFLGITQGEYENYVKNDYALVATINAYQERALRMTGRTTRMIDGLVQTLFIAGRCVLQDHQWEGKNKQGESRSLARVLDIIVHRLEQEHGLVGEEDFVYNKTYQSLTLTPKYYARRQKIHPQNTSQVSGN